MSVEAATPVAVRGGVVRISGYVVGSVVAVAASVLLLRHLGVVDFGRYVAVIALLGIAEEISDLGMSIVGQRRYVLAPTGARARLLSDLLVIRLLATPLAVIAAVGVASVIGFTEPMVLGTVVAGGGLIAGNAGRILTIPLFASFRFGALTATELARQVAGLAWIVAMVALGADLLAFFGGQLVGGVVSLGLTLALVGPRVLEKPRLRLRRLREVLREAVPVALSQAIDVAYVRILVLQISVLASQFAAGLFATSYRIMERALALPPIVMTTVFPILAHAAENDEPRLSRAMQRLGEVGFAGAALLVVTLVVGAKPLVVALGGNEYAGAAPVLRIQALALLAAVFTQLWVFGLLAIRRYRELVAIAALGTGTTLCLGFAVIPSHGARGAAWVAVLGEFILACSALVCLVRARRSLRPALGYVPKVLFAGAVAVVLGFAVPLPDAAGAALAAATYLALAALLGVLPRDLREALRTPTDAVD